MEASMRYGGKMEGWRGDGKIDEGWRDERVMEEG